MLCLAEILANYNMTYFTFISPVSMWRSIPVVALSKVSVCGRSLAGIASYNSARGKDVCFLWVLCVVRLRFRRRADHLSRGVLQCVVCLSVIVNSR